MTHLYRHRAWLWALVPLLAGALLGLAWWDWGNQGMLRAYTLQEPIYTPYRRRLVWTLAIAATSCLGLWRLSKRIDPTAKNHPARASIPFAAAWLIVPFFFRYTWHPWGVQPGSSIWGYGLSAVTTIIVALPLSRLLLSTRRRPRYGALVVGAMAALYVLIFGFLGAARHTAFRSHALDMGAMDQAAWNTIHGRILERTPLHRHPADGSRYENRFLDAKLELIFVPLSALYWLAPDPRILLLVQTLLLAAGAVPLYLLLVEQSHDTRLAAAVACAYLLYLPLHYVDMAGFHPSALMTPFLIAAWRAQRNNTWRWYYFWLVLSLCCRIEAAIVALALGPVILLWSKKRRWRHALTTALIAAIWLWVNFGLVLPAARNEYGADTGTLLERRFGAWGDTPAEIVRTVFTHPASIAGEFDRETLQTLFDLLMPLGFASLISPLALLPALPILGINLLAQSAWQNSVHAHYMAPLIPFIWIAAGEGVSRLAGQHRRGQTWPVAAALALFILLNTALTGYLFSPYPPGQAFHLADFYQPSIYQRNLRQVIALLPDQAPVCAQSDIYPHLSQRRDAALFPNCQLDETTFTDYVIVDLDATSDKSPVDFHTFYLLVDQWLAKPDWGVVAQRGGVLLLEQGAARDNMAQVYAALDKYGREFYRVEFVENKTPAAMQANDLYLASIVLRNTGSQCWHSRGQLPVRLSYHWQTPDGQVVHVASLRTDLPHRVEPGHVVRLQAQVLSPTQAGEYVLEWSMLREGDAWFGDRGGQTLKQTVIVE